MRCSTKIGAVVLELGSGERRVWTKLQNGKNDGRLKGFRGFSQLRAAVIKSKDLRLEEY